MVVAHFKEVKRTQIEVQYDRVVIDDPAHDSPRRVIGQLALDLHLRAVQLE